jgi:hypothetical protein
MDRDALDGNAAAAALADLFVPDITVAFATCASCGAVARVAELRAYIQAPGIVLRCTKCGQVQLRMVRATDRAWLDLRGVSVLQLEQMAPP